MKKDENLRTTVDAGYQSALTQVSRAGLPPVRPVSLLGPVL